MQRIATTAHAALLVLALLGALAAARPADAAAPSETGQQEIRATVIELDDTPGRATLTAVTDDGRVYVLPNVPLRSEQFRIGSTITIACKCYWSRLGGLICRDGWQPE